MLSVNQADQWIPAFNQDLEFKKRGVTKDIISVIIWANDLADQYTKDWAGKIQLENKKDLYALWFFVRKNIKYVADQNGREIIKSPAALWHLRKTAGGDCKSFSLFFKSVCSNKGLRGGYRFVAWNQGEDITHVYPFVFLGKQR